jgi:fluoride ion exporter CrcB/FEX
MLETANLMKDGQNFRAFLNVGGSVVFGFVVFKLGILLGKII